MTTNHKYVLSVTAGLLLVAATAGAEDPRVEAAAPAVVLREYKSPNLHVHTDLAEEDAQRLFARLEMTLKFAARYWGRAPRGQIDCYVVDQLDNWTDEQLPHRLARVIVGGVGGASVPEMIGRGQNARTVPTIFASSVPGIAEHEVVHAYCTQTFGSAGPAWYKEGMAEMVVRSCTRRSGLVCTPQQIAELRKGQRATVRDVLSSGQTGNRIFTSLQKMWLDPKYQPRHIPLSAWTQRDRDNVALARREYLRTWAFCYMMLHNPNYSKRFRTLGKNFVTGQRASFDDLFGAAGEELVFEYAFFLKHVDTGYRVDLCRWDWHQRFQTMDRGESCKIGVLAARGFQASRITVVKGRHYAYETKGTWGTCAQTRVNADGGVDGSGQLIGAIMNDYKIGEPFGLGCRGEWVAPADGLLYLRCRDAWHELSDNHGQVFIRFTGR